MKKAISIPVLSLLLLTGCAAADAEPEAVAPPPSATPSAPVSPAAQDTEEQACTKLMGTDGSGPLYESIRLVRISDGTFGFQPSTPEKTERLHQTVLAAADAAPEDLGALLTDLSSGTAGALQVAESSEGWSVYFSPEGWSAAAGQLLSRCAPYEPAAASVPAGRISDPRTLWAPGSRATRWWWMLRPSITVRVPGSPTSWRTDG